MTPAFENFYPPPILTKHPIWYSLNTNLFIVLHGTPYGLHWRHLILFQEIVTHGEPHLIGPLPHHPIPFDMLKHNLFNNILILLYHDTVKLNHLTRNNWVDIKRLCIDWYFPNQTTIIIQKFCEFWYQQLPPMQRFLVRLLPVQQILRWQNLEERHQWQVHMIQVEESEEAFLHSDKHAWLLYSESALITLILLCFSPYFTFTPPFLHCDYLISLLQGHMAIHVPPLWLISTLILDSFILYLWFHRYY